MSAVNLRRRLVACYDPLGAENEDRNDHVDKDPVRGAPQKEFSTLICRISARGPSRSAFAPLLSAIATAVAAKIGSMPA
jgi:hypothetical protein